MPRARTVGRHGKVCAGGAAAAGRLEVDQAPILQELKHALQRGRVAGHVPPHVRECQPAAHVAAVQVHNQVARLFVHLRKRPSGVCYASVITRFRYFRQDMHMTLHVR